MATNEKAPRKAKASKTIQPNHTHGEIAGAVAGEVVGGIVGSMAGPPGAAAGMVLGSAAGALAGRIMDQEAERAHRHDDDLDDAIGVTRGPLGLGRKARPLVK